MCERTSEDEATRFDADDLLDLFLAVERGQFINHAPKGHWVLEQRRDVVKQNTGLGIVRNLADEFLIVHSGGRV